MPPMILNPTRAKFPPSAEHDLILFPGTPDAQPAVTDYLLEILSGATVVSSTSVGKPAPVGGFLTPLLPPLTNGPYVPRIVVRGPGGSSPPTVGPSFGYVTAPTAVSDVTVI